MEIVQAKVSSSMRNQCFCHAHWGWRRVSCACT